MLQFSQAAPGLPLVLGRSYEGRAIEATIIGRPDATERVLVLAGQHGDEVLGIEAVQRLVDRWRPQAGRAVAFIPCANPDGRAAGSRRNARGQDLNRDHQLLGTPECRAVHVFARTFAPDLIIDVHTFKPRRRRLLQHGLEWGADVMIEIDNQPNRLAAYSHRWNGWIRPVIDALGDRDVRCDRYLLASRSAYIRSSSADLVDARNGLSARIGAAGVLVEGREPSRRFGSVDRTRRSIEQTVEMLIGRWWAFADAPSESSGLAYLDVRRAGTKVTAYTLTRHDSVPRRRELPGRARTELQASRPIVLPRAYGVPRRCIGLRTLLARHGISAASEAQVRWSIGAEEVAMVEGGRPRNRSVVTGAVRRPKVRWVAQRPRDAEMDFYFLGPDDGEWLAAQLEPGSRFGLHRYPYFEIPVVAGRPYSVVRGLGKS